MGHAITASTIANVNRHKGGKAYKPADFMPKFSKREQSLGEQLQFASMMTIALGGEDLRKDIDGQHDNESGGSSGS
jgi:hypothetical protein